MILLAIKPKQKSTYLRLEKSLKRPRDEQMASRLAKRVFIGQFWRKPVLI